MKFTDPNSFKWLINKIVRIHCSGKESQEGRLLAVKDDHLVLLTGEQHLYFQLHHVKSVVFDTLENLPMCYQHHSVASTYLDVLSFPDILQKMMYRRVLINQSGPESVSGILTRLLDNHVDLVRGQEVIKVAIFHIKNICYDLNEKVDVSKTERSVDKKSEVKEEIPAKTVERISSVNETPKPVQETTLSENRLAESVQETKISSDHMAKSEQVTPSTQTKVEDPISTHSPIVKIPAPTIDFALEPVEHQFPDSNISDELPEQTVRIPFTYSAIQTNPTVEPQMSANQKHDSDSCDYVQKNNHSPITKAINRRQQTTSPKRKRWKIINPTKTKNIGVNISRHAVRNKWFINKKIRICKNRPFGTVWLAPQIRCGMVSR